MREVAIVDALPEGHVLKVEVEAIGNYWERVRVALYDLPVLQLWDQHALVAWGKRAP